MLKPSCCYQVDAQDRLVAIRGAWNAFARENGGEAILTDSPIGHSIWDFIEGLSTRNIYYIIMKQVRESGRPANFPFRADSPETLRYMAMKVSLGEDESLWFYTGIAKEVPREAAAVDNGRSPGEKSFVHMCAWCNLVQVGEAWLPLEDAIWALGLFDTPKAPPITHGICPDCTQQINENIQKRKEEQLDKLFAR